MPSASYEIIKIGSPDSSEGIIFAGGEGLKIYDPSVISSERIYLSGQETTKLTEAEAKARCWQHPECAGITAGKSLLNNETIIININN